IPIPKNNGAINGVVGVDSLRSYIVPPEVLKRREQFWEQFFYRYSDQFTDDIELDIRTLKPCKSECRPQITHKPRSVVQYWVNTGYLPYQISIRKVDYIKSINSNTGKSNIHYMKPCYDESSLSSSVDTATYILQNINTTNKEKRMAIMGEAKPQNTITSSNTTYYENAETTQRANGKELPNDKSHELPPNNFCEVTHSESCELFSNKSCELSNSTFCELQNKESCDLQSNKSCELPNNKTCELSSDKSCELLSNKSCELSNNKSYKLQNNRSCDAPNNKSCKTPNNISCELQNNRFCDAPNNKSCETPNNKSCELQNNRSCDTQNNKSCETPNNKSCETPNNKSCETSNNKSHELLNDMSCELSKIQSSSMYSKQSYLEKSLLNSDVTQIRHRKKLYTGRNSPVDLVTMKKCNKQVFCKMQQHIHPALDFGYSLPNKLNIKRRRQLKNSCIINKNLENVSQVISNFKRSAQTGNGQNYFDLLHMTLANQSVITNDKDDNYTMDNNCEELNGTMVRLKKIRSKTRKKSNKTFAQSKNVKLSRNNSYKCTKKPNKHMKNLKNLNPTVLLTKLSNCDIQKYKKLNNLLHNFNPVIRLKRLAKFDIQKYKKSTNVMKNTKYLNAIVSLEKLSDTAIKRYKTSLNMKKHSEINLLSDTFQLPYSVNKCQHFLNNTFNSLQSSPNVIKISSNDTDSDQSTVLMYRCNSKTSDTLSTSNISVFSKNTHKDVQSEKSIDNTLHISTNSQNSICSTPSHKSKIIAENINDDNTYIASGKKIKLSSTVETSDSVAELITPRHYLRSGNSQDNLGSTHSHKSKIIPEDNNADNAYTTSSKKIKLSSTVEISDSVDELIKPRHHLRHRNSQHNLGSTHSHKSNIIPTNNNDDNVHKTSDKRMTLSSPVQASDTDGVLIKPRHYLRSRNSQDNLGSSLSHKTKIIHKNNNDGNVHKASDKKMKLSSTVETSDSNDELIKPRRLRPRNSQDNLGSTLSPKLKIIHKNNNNVNVQTTPDKTIKLSSTVQTSNTDDALIKPRHCLRSKNSQNNLYNTLSRKSKILPNNNNDNDNEYTTSGKKMNLSFTKETSDVDDALIKHRHCLRSKKTLNVTKEQCSNECNTTKPCRESGKIKSRMEAVIINPTESLHDVNYIHFETNLFDFDDSDFTSSILSE
ncbi:uncharacterized protein LOC105663347, partial [Megachile rotundata]|uniref:uncharacterized protein LOC105663347 n=1 Tax=Megachile rotundata TaxID=143995 RepID=UPI003FD43216